MKRILLTLGLAIGYVAAVAAVIGFVILMVVGPWWLFPAVVVCAVLAGCYAVAGDMLDR